MDLFERDILKRVFNDSKDDIGECEMPKTALPSDMPIAMAYVPYQRWEKPYETDVALGRGTIFPSLDKPFIGEEAVKNADTK